MAIDYKKELESAARSMILVHEPDTLIRMIVRMMIQKVQVRHAGILLHEDSQKTYVLRVSRGLTGLKIPPGFARMDYDNPLIRFFRDHREKRILGDRIIISGDINKLLRRKIKSEVNEILNKILYQMNILEAVACVPSYYQDELLGILFLGKKKNGREFHRKELDFFIALASDVAMAIRNARLFKQLQDELVKKQQLFLNTTITLAAAVEAKDRYTRGHTERVTNLVLGIGRRLMKERLDLGEDFLENLHIAALLHDIGKIGIPEAILNKEDSLNHEEAQKMKTHPIVGATILQHIKELEHVILGVKYHHERFDGRGYPEGLSGDRIPLIAAIIAVADSFDAMTTDRPYRKAKSKESAITEIESLSGQQFHPKIVSIFTQLYKEGEI